jgi:hypothetical protein
LTQAGRLLRKLQALLFRPVPDYGDAPVRERFELPFTFHPRLSILQAVVVTFATSSASFSGADCSPSCAGTRSSLGSILRIRPCASPLCCPSCGVPAGVGSGDAGDQRFDTSVCGAQNPSSESSTRPPQAMVKRLRLRLGRVEDELRDFQRHFPAINAC